MLFTVRGGWGALVDMYVIKNNYLEMFLLVGTDCACWSLLINSDCKCEFVNGNTAFD